jgi:hypothetical protein
MGLVCLMQFYFLNVKKIYMFMSTFNLCALTCHVLGVYVPCVEHPYPCVLASCASTKELLVGKVAHTKAMGPTILIGHNMNINQGNNTRWKLELSFRDKLINIDLEAKCVKENTKHQF